MRNLLHKAVQLTGAGLINPSLICQPKDPDSFQNTKCAESITVGRVLRCFETDRNMALCTKVVDLIRLNLLNDPNQIGAVGQIAVMQNQTRIRFMGILVKVVNP